MIESCLTVVLAMSVHFGLDGTYNEIHPSIRCNVNNTIAGVYYNSESTFSTYVGHKFGVLELGIATGYSGSTFVPMLRLVKDGWFITPAYETEPAKNLGVTVGYEFDLGENL